MSIIILILYLDILRFAIYDRGYNISFSYTFLLIIASTNILTIPFLFFHLSFSFYKISLLFLYIIIGLFLCKGRLLSYANYRLKSINKEFIFIFGTIILSGLFVAIFSTNSSDSYLYMRMVLYPIQNNQFLATTQLHSYDTYYPFISFITSFTSKDYYLYAMTAYKFFETFIILAFSYKLSKDIFKEKYLYAYTLICIGILGQITFLLPTFFEQEGLGSLFKVSPSGTVLLLFIIIPALFLNMYKQKSDWFELMIITLAGLSFSSSMLYIYPIFFVLKVAYSLFYDKDNLQDVVRSCVYPMYLVLFYWFLYFIAPKTSTFSSIIVIIIILLAYTLIIRYIKYISNDTLLKLAKVTLSLYVVFNFIYISYNHDLLDAIRGFLNLGIDKRYPSHNYPNYFTHGLIAAVCIIGFLSVRYKDKKLIRIIIINILFACNYFVYLGLGNVISAAVYHRVFVFAGIYFLFIYGVLHLMSLVPRISFRNSFVISSTFILFISVSSQISLTKGQETNNNRADTYKLYNYNILQSARVDLKYDFNKTLYANKIDNDDVLYYMNYDFNKSSNIQTMQKKRWEKGIDQIFQLRTELDKIDMCVSDCYFIVDKENDLYLDDYEFETPSTYLYYIE